MKETAKEEARRLILEGLRRRTDENDTAIVVLTMPSRQEGTRLKAIKHVLAMEMELRMRRYFERGDLAGVEGFVVLDGIGASTAEEFFERGCDEGWRNLIEMLSSVRQDGERAWLEEAEPEAWLRCQYEYAYENRQDDPRKAECPTDSGLWLALFKAAMKSECGYELTERLRRLRRDGTAVLSMTERGMRMRSARGRELEYEAFRARIGVLGTELARVMRLMGAERNGASGR